MTYIRGGTGGGKTRGVMGAVVSNAFRVFSLGHFFKLAVVEVRVEAAFGQQLVVGALLDDVAVLEHQDQVGVLDGGQTVGDDKAGAVFGEPVHGLLCNELGPGIHRGGSFVQNQHWVVLNHGSGNGQQLLLAGGDRNAAVQHRVKALRQRLNEVVDAAGTAGRLQLLVRHAGFVVDQILPDSAFKQPGVLQNHAEQVVDALPGHFRGGDSVDLTVSQDDIKDPDNPKRWIVDEEAAQVVRRIYSMTLEGYGTEQIAASLEQDGILTPRAYWLKKGIKRPGKGKEQPPTKWNSSSVTKILSLQEYCGDILNFKTYSKSYKNKKRLENDRENWVVFKDVHEPIIERAVFEQVQQKRGKIRKRRTHEGERNMFSGLLVCADCGHNLHFHFNQGNPDIKYFNCSNYKGNRGSCTSTHYVRVDFLEQVVLGEIRRLTKFASQFEDEFVKAVIGHSQQAEATDRKLKEKELKALQARDEELDGLFERIYEDNVSGKLSDDRFARMSRRYEEEQKELAEKIKALRAEIDKQNSQSMTTDMFISLVRKYTRARKLTPRMLNELIEKIEVFNAEKIDGVWEQRLRIHYNCVGVIEIPELGLV